MPIGIKANETWRFQLQCDRKPDGTLDPTATVWILRTLSATADARVRDALATVILPRAGDATDAPQRAQFNSGSQMLEILREGLAGVENFFYADGTPVPFEARNLSNFLTALSPEHRIELANAITERTQVPASLGN